MSNARAAADGNERQAESLYAAREKIYPREVSGRYARLRVLAVWVLLGLYYVLPWIPWSGRQAVLFDLPARKFYIFGLTLWPQDFIYLSLLLIIAALALFFFTAMLGRVWCGFACPQTVWTEVFIWMERITEGPRNKRIKLDKGPWNRDKILRKGAKQALWISFAAFTGFTFVGYFTPIVELAGKLASISLGPWETFWVVFYGFATYGNAGFMREQVCKYMCPYARFQSAMFDKDTLIISYDEARGEPRGKRRRKADPKAEGLGDCINCMQCVHVCPTGIDIRDGLQYECIACAACVDVCNNVMDQMEYPRGLIRYTTEHALQNEGTHVFRPRIAVYGTLLLILFGAFAWSIGNRLPLRMDVLHDRNALYRLVGDDMVENVYTLKITNMDDVPRRYTLSAAGLPGLVVDTELAGRTFASGEIAAAPVRLRVPRRDLAGGGHDVTLTLKAVDAEDVLVEEKARFLAPVAGR